MPQPDRVLRRPAGRLHEQNDHGGRARSAPAGDLGHTCPGAAIGPSRWGGVPLARYRRVVPIESRERIVVRPAPAAPRPRPAPAPRRKRSPRANRRLARTLLVGALILALVIGGAAYLWDRYGHMLPTCTASIGDESYRITPEQADNARLIADVARVEGLPNHAVTVALAAALQESKLRNISHGDRDSVGLFQQRPSQGWGTTAQLTDPRYAATAFYRALAEVDGWETMSVTDAAQEVQISAAPDAYAKWEGEARVLARILTNEVPDEIECVNA
jgi:hypothetical protein